MADPSGNRGRLLVIDFDYFFPDPMLAPGAGSEVVLYDWHHAETPFLHGPVWLHRAAAFFNHGYELPRCAEDTGSGPGGGFVAFWQRFDLTGAPGLLVCDSNAFAGTITPASLDAFAGDGGDSDRVGWAEVWLYDAHHDCGYRATGATEWAARGTLGCDDWMRAHHARGTALHVRYPAWRADADGVLADVERAPAVPVDRAVDDGQPAGAFDAVVVCRSGAWVPPWCDDQFEAFLNAAPDYLGTPHWIDDDVPPGPRDFDADTARAIAALPYVPRLIADDE